ncbi:hypothetical protein, partial [Vibrio splendidus]|uniref:hypothetical protein n=1 Tax=Vibrio splendidus TaxID=29497 RepID=UPI001A7E0F76
ASQVEFSAVALSSSKVPQTLFQLANGYRPLSVIWLTISHANEVDAKIANLWLVLNRGEQVDSLSHK